MQTQIARVVIISSLELMQDIWPSRDNISEESACSRFGGSSDIETEVTIIEHTHADWVGESQVDFRWSDNEEDDTVDSRTTVIHAKGRAEAIDCYRRKIIEGQSHNTAGPHVGARRHHDMSRSVSFNETVIYVEPKVLHACQGLFSLVGASFESKANGCSNFDTTANSFCHTNSSRRTQGVSAHIDQIRKWHGQVAHSDFLLSKCEGETKRHPSIPHRSCLPVIPISSLSFACCQSVCAVSDSTHMHDSTGILSVTRDVPLRQYYCDC